MLLALVTQQFHGANTFPGVKDTAAQTCLLCLDRPTELGGAAVPALFALSYSARFHLVLYFNQAENELS